jgi:predicted dehydrogenase
MVGVGVIGYGYWGPNLVRNFSEARDTRVVGVSDMRADRIELAERRCPGIQVTTNYRELLDNPQVDAIAISTPVSTHFPLAMEALRAGKHVLVEKPLTTSSEDALRLIEEADKRRLTLMVDHTFVYTGAVRKIKELMTEGRLGDAYYYDSTRINLGLFQHDVDVIWDLAVHDLAIMDFLLPLRPCAVAATGISHVEGRSENTAYLTLFFPGSLIAHINVNWLSPVKVRRTLIGGSKQMIVYDDMEASEKIKVYDKGITVKNGPESVYKMMVKYRAGDMYSPALDVTEALTIEAQHFAECLQNGTPALTDGQCGLRVVRMLEAATESMRNRGRLVELELDQEVEALVASA